MTAATVSDRACRIMGRGSAGRNSKGCRLTEGPDSLRHFICRESRSKDSGSAPLIHSWPGSLCSDLRPFVVVTIHVDLALLDESAVWFHLF